MHFVSKSCVLLYFQRYCTALEQWASAKLCGVVSSRDRAAILFNIRRSNCLVYFVPFFLLLLERFFASMIYITQGSLLRFSPPTAIRCTNWCKFGMEESTVG